MRVTYPGWPVWGPHFKELDVRSIDRVLYYDWTNEQKELGRESYRLTIGRNGISGFVLLNKPNLPKLFQRSDAVIVEYQA